MINRQICTLAILTSLLTSTQAQAGSFLLIPKLGVHQHDTSEITIGSNVITLKDKGDAGVLGFEGGYLFDFGLSLTGEILLYQLDVANETDGPLRGEVNVGSFTANATYHFNHEGRFQPLIGFGFGSQVADIENSNSNAELIGYRVQGKLGFLLEFTDNIGMILEYKRVYFSLEDEDNDTITYSSRGNFYGAGVAIQF